MSDVEYRWQDAKLVVFSPLEVDLVRNLTLAIRHFYPEEEFIVSVKEDESLDKSISQIIIRDDGAEILENGVTSQNSFGINLYAENFEKAKSFGSKVESVLRVVPLMPGSIRRCTIQSSFYLVKENTDNSVWLNLTGFVIMQGKSLNT